MPPSRVAVVASVMVIAFALGGCGDNVAQHKSAPQDSVRIASFDFTESAVIAEIYAQSLEGAGISVTRVGRVGSREVVEPALEQGVIDVVPEYTGSALTFLNQSTAPADAESAFRTLQDALRPLGITTLTPSPAYNRNEIVVTQATAERLNLHKISDLAPIAKTLVFGGPPECPERRLCLSGLQSVYGLQFKAFRSLDVAGPLTVGALQGNEVDVALLFTTTPQVDTERFVVLEDDRALQPAENIVPVVRTPIVDRYGQQLSSAIDKVNAQLTSADLRSLINAVDAGKSASEVCGTWMKDHFAGAT